MASLRTLFGGSRFLAWVLAPALVVFALVMLQAAGGMTSTGRAVAAALSAVAVLLALALMAPRRFRWAGRVVAGAVFLAYVVYAANELLLTRHRLFEDGPTSPFSALVGLAFIGLPALWYAVSGRFGWREEPILLAADDPLVVEAVQRARATIGEFLRLYPEHRESTAVKLSVATGEDAGEVEGAWAEVVDLRPPEVAVRLLTPPVADGEAPPQGGPVSQLITLPLAHLEDWQVVLADGGVRGGFTVQAMIAAYRRDGMAIPRHLRGARFLDAVEFSASARGPMVRV